jgi:hypothetical protein
MCSIVITIIAMVYPYPQPSYGEVCTFCEIYGTTQVPWFNPIASHH